jgi:hypothetical protein
MATEPTIADACRVQRDLGLLDVHVAYVDLDTDWFVLAHTDAERENQAMISLSQCAVHIYLDAGGLGHKLCCIGQYVGTADSRNHPPRFVFAQTGWYVLPTSSLHDVHGLAL